MNDLRLSIHQTFGQIGIQSQQGSLSVRSGRGDLQIQQPPAVVNMQSPSGDLQIDSSAAWDALAKGSVFAMNSRIYSQCESVALQAIAKTVQEGNRMAQISNKGNPFAELAADVFQRESPIEIAGGPGYNNVHITYTPRQPQIDAQPQRPTITYTPQKTDIQYTPGNVEVYMKQMNSIQVSVSQYDLYK